MVVYVEIFLAVTAIHLINCDWVEIPQTVVSDKEKLTEKTDITMYILTTTSTTTQTPIFAKPVIRRKANITKISSKFKGNRNSTNRKLINSTTHMPTLVQTPSTNKKSSTTSPNNKKLSSTVNTLKTFTQALKGISKTSPKINNTNIAVNINVTSRLTSNITSNSKNKIELEETNHENLDEDADVEEPIESEKDGDDAYSYTNFVPYLSSIQSTLMKNAHKSKKSKLHVLKDLRDHLLIEIENRITNLWNPKAKNRDAREYKDDSHVDFPSNEGALMTIGFLTFAVFLIKLVLQLVQTISNKMDTGDGTTTTTYYGRKRRAIVDDEAVKILNYIEQFQFK